jgi:WD40 repeat protein
MMIRSSLIPTLGWLALGSALISSGQNALIAQTPVYFEDAVAPILRKNCIACHNAKLSEGGLNLETPMDIAKGGDSGAIIDSKDIEMSLLISLPAGKVEPIMPPDGNTVGADRLTPAQLSVIKNWIAGGSLSKGPSANMPNPSTLRLPETARASYALAISPNMDFAVFGRGGQLVIHSTERLTNGQKIEGMIDATPMQVIPDAHPDFIHSVAISADGQRIATGSTGQIKIWKQSTSTIDSIRLALEKAEIPITNLFGTSTDGNLFASLKKRASPPSSEPNPKMPGIITMLNREGEVLYSFDVPDSNLVCSTWSPSNRRFFAVGSNRMLYAWDLGQSPIASPSQTQLPKEVSVIVSLDESNVMLVSERSASVWQYKVPTVAEIVPAHPLVQALNAAGPLDLVNVSPDRTKLVAVTKDDKASTSTLKLWSVAQSKLLGAIERDRNSRLAYFRSDRFFSRVQAAVERSKASVTELEKALEAETTAVATAKTNREKAVEAAAKKEQERVAAVQAVADHEKAMAETKAAIEAATQKLTTLTTELEPKKKKVAEVETQKVEANTAMDNATQSITATEQSQKAAQYRLEARKKFSAQLAEELATAQSSNEKLKAAADGVKFSVASVAFANNTTIAATAIRPADQTTGNSSAIDLFSTETLERIDSQPVQESIPSQPSLMAILNAAIAKSSWQMERLLDSPRIIADRVTALAFSPDGSKLAIGSGLPSRNGQLAIVAVSDGSPVPPLADQPTNTSADTCELHSDTILGLSYSPDGRWLASCGADKMTKLIDTQANKVVKIFEGHTHHVLALAWQDTGHRLATASADSTVKIWDIEKGEAVRTVTGFGTEVTAMAYIGKTANVVSSTLNNLVRMHDSDSGKQVKQFSPALDSLFSIAVTPDGKYTLSVGQEGVVRVWQIDDGRLVGEWK